MAATLLATTTKSIAGLDSSISHRIQHLPPLRTNVSSTERWLSALGAGVFTSWGLMGRGAAGFSTVAGGFLLYRAVTGNCPFYQMLNMNTSDTTAPNSVIAAGHGTRVDHSIRVRKPIATVYQFWRDFENFPRFMTHVLDVDTTSDGQSRWRVRGPLGITVEWECELISDMPNEVISWKSIDGSDVDIAGSVRFRELPGTSETEVHVSLKYDPPVGKFGAAMAKLFGQDPDVQIREDMNRFKEIMESK